MTKAARAWRDTWSLDAVIEQTGAPGSIHVHVNWEPLTGDETEMCRRLAAYGVE